LVLIELEEGVRMMSALVEYPNDGLRINMSVEVVFDDITIEVNAA
jgi:uncharacterized OB-fold protein